MSEKMEIFNGNVNEIVRMGDTVHRTKNWNSNVHKLLKYLELQGFEGVPKYIGIDENGSEVLSFISGDVPGNEYPNYKPYIWSDRTIQQVAKILRSYHDLTQNFISTAMESKWYNPYIDEKHYEIICHNDAALYNFVFRGEIPVALIDFDTASPGTRIWDIAYTLYTSIPLASFEPERETGAIVAYVPELHAKNRSHRISLFFRSYGMPVPKDMKEWVIKRIEALCDTLVKGAEQGNKAYQKMIDEGHLAHYEKEILFLEEHFDDWSIEE